MEKKKIEVLDVILKNLINTQLWLKNNGKPKNVHVSKKIHYINSVKEYLIYGTTLTQHGRSDNRYLKDKQWYYYLLEDAADKSLNRFIRKINNIAFDTIDDISKFRYLKSRLQVNNQDFIDPEDIIDIFDEIISWFKKLFKNIK